MCLLLSLQRVCKLYANSFFRPNANVNYLQTKILGVLIRMP